MPAGPPSSLGFPCEPSIRYPAHAMKNLRSPLPLLLFASCTLASAGCTIRHQSGYNFDYSGSTARYSKSYEISAETLEVEIRHRFGDVHVEEASGSETPGWVWELTTWADDDARARHYLDQVSLETLQDGSRLSFELMLPESPGSELRGVKSVLRVTLQPGTQLELTNAHGDAYLSDLTGELETDLSHGDGHYENLSARVRLEHAHGALSLVNLQAGYLDASHTRLTASGLHQDFEIDASHTSLELSEVHARLDLEASHSPSKLEGCDGALRFDGSHSELQFRGDPSQLDLESSHGDLLVECTGVRLDALDAEVEHADFELFLPPGYDLQMRVDTQHGSAQNHMPNSPGGKPLRLDVEISHGAFDLRAGGEGR